MYISFWKLVHFVLRIIYFGKLTDFSGKGNSSLTTVMLYTPKKETVKGKEIAKEVDRQKLQQWLAEKFGDKKVICKLAD